MVMDRFARQALRPREYWEGVVVGGLIFGAIACLTLGFAWGLEAEGGFSALVCILAAVINAAAFTNDHWLGLYVYGAAAALAGVGASYTTLDAFAGLHLPFAGELGGLIMLLGIATTWLRGLGVLYRVERTSKFVPWNEPEARSTSSSDTRRSPSNPRRSCRWSGLRA
jgi:hypothetical protein